MAEFVPNPLQAMRLKISAEDGAQDGGADFGEILDTFLRIHDAAVETGERVCPCLTCDPEGKHGQSCWYGIPAEGPAFEIEVDRMVRLLVEGAAHDGRPPSEIEFVTNVTELPDDQVALLAARMKAAEVSITLIDDGPAPRAGTVRSPEMKPQ